MATSFKKELLAYISCLIGSVMMLLFVVSCATARSPQLPAKKVYIPPCGHEVQVEKINKNIREKNECSSCGKIFFYTPVVESMEPERYAGYGRYGARSYGPSSSYQSDISYQHFGVGGYSFKENDYGFSELSWYFRDSKVKSYRVVPRGKTRCYDYP